MSWKYAWQYRLKVLRETVSTPQFWYMLLGVLGALLVWAGLFYLAIKYADTTLSLHSTFCSSENQRNRHLLAIILLTPLFIVGMLGVISEWMTLMENRRRKRKSKYAPLIAFSGLMQLSTLLILFALDC